MITHRREVDAKHRKQEKEATERKQLKKKQLERQTRLKQEKEERDKREEAHVFQLLLFGCTHAFRLPAFCRGRKSRPLRKQNPLDVFYRAPYSNCRIDLFFVSEIRRNIKGLRRINIHNI